MLGIPIIFFDSKSIVNLTFEEQDIFALQFQYLTFENQSKTIFFPDNYTQLTFENQSKTIFFPDNYTQLTFEEQNKNSL